MKGYEDLIIPTGGRIFLHESKLDRQGRAVARIVRTKGQAEGAIAHGYTEVVPEPVMTITPKAEVKPEVKVETPKTKTAPKKPRKAASK